MLELSSVVACVHCCLDARIRKEAPRDLIDCELPRLSTRTPMFFRHTFCIVLIFKCLTGFAARIEVRRQVLPNLAGHHVESARTQFKEYVCSLFTVGCDRFVAVRAALKSHKMETSSQRCARPSHTCRPALHQGSTRPQSAAWYLARSSNWFR